MPRGVEDGDGSAQRKRSRTQEERLGALIGRLRRSEENGPLILRLFRRAAAQRHGVRWGIAGAERSLAGLLPGSVLGTLATGRAAGWREGAGRIRGGKETEHRLKTVIRAATRGSARPTQTKTYHREDEDSPFARR